MSSSVKEILQTLVNDKTAGSTGAAVVTIQSWDLDETLPEVELWEAFGEFEDDEKAAKVEMVASSMLGVVKMASQHLNFSEFECSKYTTHETTDGDYVILAPCTREHVLFVKARKKAKAWGYLHSKIQQAVNAIQALLKAEDHTNTIPIQTTSPEGNDTPPDGHYTSTETLKEKSSNAWGKWS